MADVEDYSTTPASNIADFPENQAPSTVNDGGRETQADIAAWHQRITGTVTAGGTADALTATFSPAHTALAERMVVIKAASDNATTTPTLNLDGLGAKTIVKNGNEALVAGDIQAGAILVLWYSTANTNWELLNPAYRNVEDGAVITAKLGSGAVTSDKVTWAFGSGGTWSIASTASQVIPAGVYTIAVGASGLVFQVNQGASWWGTTASYLGGTVISDGTNARILNPTGGAITVYYRQLA